MVCFQVVQHVESHCTDLSNLFAFNNRFSCGCVYFHEMVTNRKLITPIVFLAEDNIPAKILSYNRANRAVAILCNHQRAPPKTFEKSMQNLQAKVRFGLMMMMMWSSLSFTLFLHDLLA